MTEEEKMREKMTKLLASDNDVRNLVKTGTKLLEESEKPNIITYAQFEPFVELFRIDKERYDERDEYYYAMNRLYNRYKSELNINLYQPTIVVNNLVERKEMGFLNRVYTRIRPDVVENGQSRRELVPALPLSQARTQEQLLMEASLGDLVDSNTTEAQKAYFNRLRGETALLQKLFLENNASEKTKEELLGSKDSSNNSVSDTGSVAFELDDDDE